MTQVSPFLPRYITEILWKKFLQHENGKDGYVHDSHLLLRKRVQQVGYRKMVCAGLTRVEHLQSRKQ